MTKKEMINIIKNNYKLQYSGKWDNKLYSLCFHNIRNNFYLEYGKRKEVLSNNVAETIIANILNDKTSYKLISIENNG